MPLPPPPPSMNAATAGSHMNPQRLAMLNPNNPQQPHPPPPPRPPHSHSLLPNNSLPPQPPFPPQPHNRPPPSQPLLAQHPYAGRGRGIGRGGRGGRGGGRGRAPQRFGGFDPLDPNSEYNPHANKAPGTKGPSPAAAEDLGALQGPAMPPSDAPVQGPSGPPSEHTGSASPKHVQPVIKDVAPQLPKASVQPAFLPPSMRVARGRPKPDKRKLAALAAAKKRARAASAAASTSSSKKKQKLTSTDKALDDFMNEINGL